MCQRDVVSRVPAFQPGGLGWILGGIKYSILYRGLQAVSPLCCFWWRPWPSVDHGFRGSDLLILSDILFNHGHILQLSKRPSPSVDGWISFLDDYDGQMITGGECGLNFMTYLTAEEKPRKNSNQENVPSRDRTRACWVRDNDVGSRPQRWYLLFLSSVPVHNLAPHNRPLIHGHLDFKSLGV